VAQHTQRTYTAECGGENPLFGTPDAGPFKAVFRMPRVGTPDATFRLN